MPMSEELTIEIDRIDELTILMAQLKQMQVVSLLDQYFPAHVNWQGASLEKLGVVWLCHVTSKTGALLSP